MKTNNEKQVAAFDKVLGLCNDLGQKYNPGNDSINHAALNQLLTTAQESVQAAQNAKAHLFKVIRARQEAYTPLPELATRILNELIASDASPGLIEGVRATRDKLRSRPGKVAKPEDSTQPGKVADASRGPISQLDYESKLRNFDFIVTLVTNEPGYKTREPEFHVANLRRLVVSLANENKAVSDAKAAFDRARSQCNAVLYSDAGLFGATKRVKKYFLHAHGAKSDQFRTVNSISLKFKK